MPRRRSCHNAPTPYAPQHWQGYRLGEYRQPDRHGKGRWKHKLPAANRHIPQPCGAKPLYYYNCLPIRHPDYRGAARGRRRGCRRQGSLQRLARRLRHIPRAAKDWRRIRCAARRSARHRQTTGCLFLPQREADSPWHWRGAGFPSAATPGAHAAGRRKRRRCRSCLPKSTCRPNRARRGAGRLRQHCRAHRTSPQTL